VVIFFQFSTIYRNFITVDWHAQTVQTSTKLLLEKSDQRLHPFRVLFFLLSRLPPKHNCSSICKQLWSGWDAEKLFVLRISKLFDTDNIFINFWQHWSTLKIEADEKFSGWQFIWRAKGSLLHLLLLFLHFSKLSASIFKVLQCLWMSECLTA